MDNDSRTLCLVAKDTSHACVLSPSESLTIGRKGPSKPPTPAGTIDRRPGMSIIGKLFGAIGPAAPAASTASDTVRPGYGTWYSQQMARSYALRCKTGSVVQLLRPALQCELPMAA